MGKKKNEPKSRTITAEDMRNSIGFRYLGIILLVIGVLGFYYINPWIVNDGRCSAESGIMCNIGTLISMFILAGCLFGGLISLIGSYLVILSDTEEYKKYHNPSSY